MQMRNGTAIGVTVGAVALLLAGAALLFRQTQDSAPSSANSRLGPPAITSTAAAPPPPERQGLAPDPVERRAPQPVSFQLAGDFHAFAAEALNSNDGGLLYEGFQALRECEGLLWNANDLRIIADGGTARGVVHGKATEERRKAIRDVLRRCDGFSRVDYRERRAMYAAFEKRGKELGAVEFVMHARAEDWITREELAALLGSTSPAAWHLALRPLVNSANAARPENPEAAKEFDTNLGMGYLLAACDLGGHCGSDSYQGNVACAYYGRCAKSFMEGWEKEFGEARIAQVNAFRRQILDAVRTRDYSRLGL